MDMGNSPEYPDQNDESKVGIGRIILLGLLFSFLIGMLNFYVGYGAGYRKAMSRPRDPVVIDCNSFEMSIGGQDVQIVPDGYFLMMCPNSLLEYYPIKEI